MEPRADLILANRSYLDHSVPPGSGERPGPTNGGLLAAVRPVIAPWDGGQGTTWIGAGRGSFDREYTDGEGFEILATDHGPLRHRRLFFGDDDWLAHYAKVANSFTWPLFHLVRPELLDRAPYFPSPAIPTAEAWAAHGRVNAAFAQAVLDQSPGNTCWVHDYQLALVPALLRAAGYHGRTGFFLHTPFPDADVVLAALPAAGVACLGELTRGILGADLAGFQSEGDARRFQGAAVRFCGARVVEGGLESGGRMVRVAAYPVGIDTDELLAAANAPLPAEVSLAVKPGLPLVVGLERSDYTKGIPERIDAVARAFERGMRFSYVGIAAPTRPGVDGYKQLDEAITAAVGRARLAATAHGGSFLHLREAVPWEGVIALQREADVVFTSSLADGMNLVPIQSVIAQSRRGEGQRAVILTGRDAGVSAAFAGFELDGLVPVDPLDPEAMDSVLAAAVTGAVPGISDRLIAEVSRRDAHSWATHYLTGLQSVPC